MKTDIKYIERCMCTCRKPDPCFGTHPSCTDIPGTSLEDRCRDCFLCGKEIPMHIFKELVKKEKSILLKRLN